MHTQLHSNLRPVLEELDQHRQATLKKMVKTGVLSAVATLALLPLGIWLRSEELWKAAFFAPIFGAVVAGMQRQAFRSVFKDKVLHQVVKAYSPDLTYQPKGSVSLSDFNRPQIFPRQADKVEGEDLIFGKLGKTAIRFSEVHAVYQTTHTGKKRRKYTKDHTIFEGLLFQADFNKRFSGSTYVLPDRAERMLGGLGQTLQSWTASHGELVKLEDVEFERAFAVYGTDQIEARYILSPALMRRILDYRNKTGFQLFIAFKHPNITLAIRTRKNIFEAQVTRSLLRDNALQRFFEELDLFAGLVEDLNLNNRIWTKR